MGSSKRPGEEEEDFKMRSPTKVWRFAGPEHFLLTVESFSVISETKLEKYESDEFEAGGYKWRLILYPKGDKSRSGNNHISLYLSISDTKTLPHGWEVNTNFTLFVYNHISDMYLTFQVTNASERRFHKLKTEKGFDKLIESGYFMEASNGFLLDDTCVFGAEVYVDGSVLKRQCLSMIKVAVNKIFSWRIANFSTIKDKFYYSEEFKMGELEWKLALHPKGHEDGKGKSVSLYLEVADDEIKLGANWKAYAEYKLRIINQVNCINHVEIQGGKWFDNSSLAWGCTNFMALSDVNDKLKGFVVNDTLLVEAEISFSAI